MLDYWKNMTLFVQQQKQTLRFQLWLLQEGLGFLQLRTREPHSSHILSLNIFQYHLNLQLSVERKMCIAHQNDNGQIFTITCFPLRLLGLAA